MKENNRIYELQKNIDDWSNVGRNWTIFLSNLIIDIPRKLRNRKIENGIFSKDKSPTISQINYIEALLKDNSGQKTKRPDLEKLVLIRQERNYERKIIESIIEFTSTTASHSVSIITNRRKKD